MNGMRKGLIAMAAAMLALPACQSSGQQSSVAAAPAPPAAAAAPAASTAAYAAAPAPAATPGQCAIQIAGGPPPKPAKGADFGQAVAKDIGKNVGRSLISGIAGQIAGPLGGAVAQGVALNAVRPEADLKGSWTATDGSATCGCTLDVSSGINLQGRSSNKGKLAARGCTNPLLASAASWTLGHSFTGYDAPFDLMAANGQKVASLKRDGIDYFSGTLADGTPVTIWRE